MAWWSTPTGSEYKAARFASTILCLIKGFASLTVCHTTISGSIESPETTNTFGALLVADYHFALVEGLGVQLAIHGRQVSLRTDRQDERLITKSLIMARVAVSF